eukprot:Seg4664.1 transcript_id=Seg4664.1/GoldUCD/mRNA.D3Y31 product="Neuropeptide FF receptor 2" protein_id=Seg4664.1/GoldUCD/D3Y31
MHRFTWAVFVLCASVAVLHDSASGSLWSQASSNGTSNNSSANTSGPNSTNSTMPPKSKLPTKDAWHYIQVVVSVLVMILGTCGNLLVIVIFLMRHNLLKTCEVFMISLAFADLIGTFTIPLDLLRGILQFHDPGNGHFIGCQLSAWLGTTCITVSAFTLVAIAVDRFFVVAWPLRSRGGVSPMLIVGIILIWVLGSFPGIMHFLRLKQIKTEHQGYICRPRWEENEHRNYNLSLFILQMVIPMIAMSILYSIIILKLRSGTVSARRLSESDNVSRIRSRRQRKATKLFVVVVIVFISLVLPANIFHLLASYDLVSDKSISNYRIYVVVTLMQAANSCVNPLIYSRLHKSFRRSTIALIFGCCVPKYYKYDWESKFVSRSSYYRRRRGTDLSNTRYTTTSQRKSTSPCFEDPTAQTVAGTPPRSISGLSSRSSRISSSSYDEVFSRKSSLKGQRGDDNRGMHLRKIPEQNGVHSDGVNGVRKCLTPEPAPGKYIQFINCPIVEGNGKIETAYSQEPVKIKEIELQGMCPAREESSSSDGSATEKPIAIIDKVGYTNIESEEDVDIKRCSRVFIDTPC